MDAHACQGKLRTSMLHCMLLHMPCHCMVAYLGGWRRWCTYWTAGHIIRANQSASAAATVRPQLERQTWSIYYATSPFWKQSHGARCGVCLQPTKKKESNPPADAGTQHKTPGKTSHTPEKQDNSAQQVRSFTVCPAAEHSLLDPANWELGCILSTRTAIRQAWYWHLRQAAVPGLSRPTLTTASLAIEACFAYESHTSPGALQGESEDSKDDQKPESKDADDSTGDNDGREEEESEKKPQIEVGTSTPSDQQRLKRSTSLGAAAGEVGALRLPLPLNKSGAPLLHALQ